VKEIDMFGSWYERYLGTSRSFVVSEFGVGYMVAMWLAGFYGG
jgi:hypothetical protein